MSSRHTYVLIWPTIIRRSSDLLFIRPTVHPTYPMNIGSRKNMKNTNSLQRRSMTLLFPASPVVVDIYQVPCAGVLSCFSTMAVGQVISRLDERRSDE